jgi:RHH-type proline utilization regulon transcriptional repressor/proline dehydrogenase/delta 1-pyrroline-5-carboxylate dehydrogenase
MHAPTAQPGFIFDTPPPAREPLRAAITRDWLCDETAQVQRLLALAELPEARAAAVGRQAASWVRRVREGRAEQSPLDAFMREYDLSSEEGVLLMCLAEALLRIPDTATAEKLIADKLSAADWEQHLGQSDSLFVNASTWGLMLTGRIVRVPPETHGNVRAALNRLIGQSSEPVIRLAIRQAMKLMGHQFVMGAAPCALAGPAGLAPFLRHARRGGTHRRRRRTLPARLSRGDPRHRPRCGRGERPAGHGAARHLDQALRPAPALRARAAWPCTR